uniref:peptidylprolyl isomerase n=1 Tax=Anthurium amnicola TaxID=1678845 RepID=A0A1D1ZD78_9ARAE
MAFWGVEVTPAKPFVHLPGVRGALRVSQATLGDGTATKRSVVQCSVGDKSPVLLCSLLPNRAECCCLDLRFEEDDAVAFSVVGPRSVHLTGYFVGESIRGGGGAEDSDSYEEEYWEDEDWETGSEESGSYSTEDEYGLDFVDNGDIEMSPSPRPNSGVVIEEITEDGKPVNGNFNDRHMEDKLQDDSDDDVSPRGQIIVKHNKSPILESEDEDGFPISSSKNSGKIFCGDQKLTLNADRKRKLNDVSDKGSERKDMVDDLKNEKSKKKRKDKLTSAKSLESDFGTDGKMPTEEQNKDTDDKMDAAESCQQDCRKSDQEDHPYATSMIKKSRELKNKKKQKVQRKEASKTKGNWLTDKSGVEATSDKIGATSNVELANTESSNEEPPVESGQDGLSTEKDTIDSSILSATPDSTEKLNRKKKKNKKRTKDGDPLDHGNKNAGILGKDGDDKSQRMEVNENGLSKPQENKDEDQPVGELSHNTNAKSSAGFTVFCESKKQKNKKVHDNGSALVKELKLRNEVPRKPRTFANGLVIEELSMGQPDGKRASPGKTVFVRYVGKLRDGKIFDSNVGQKPFKFRLGVGQVIKGWDVGVDGMRIGDKRRLTIPPSMGYGERGAGGVIPGNAWLLFDVELVDVK